MIQLILALLLGFGVVPQPGGFDIFIQFRLTQPPRQDGLCEAPPDFEVSLQTVGNGNVNVRALPTTKSERVGVLQDGDAVYIRQSISGEVWSGSNQWYFVRAPERSLEGYIAFALIEEQPEFTWGC